MSITLGYTVPITIICNYSRTATEGHTFGQKTEHYDKLEETSKKHLNKGPTYTCGDFNARLIRKQDNGEPIGNFIFDNGNEAPSEKAQQEKVRENREMFVAHCNNTDSIAINIFLKNRTNNSAHIKSTKTI